MKPNYEKYLWLFHCKETLQIYMVFPSVIAKKKLRCQPYTFGMGYKAFHPELKRNRATEISDTTFFLYSRFLEWFSNKLKHFEASRVRLIYKILDTTHRHSTGTFSTISQATVYHSTTSYPTATTNN